MANQSRRTQKPEFRFSLNSFGHCPVQENPMEVSSRSGAPSPGWAGKMVTLKGLPARGPSGWGQK